MQATRRQPFALVFFSFLYGQCMKFIPVLIKATLLRRYKRFLADVKLSDGSLITVHCPNTGSMKNCLLEGSICWLIDSNNPKRKYRYSLEYVTTPSGALAGINSSRANKLVLEALARNDIPELAGYKEVVPEKPYGQEKSRIDLWLNDGVDSRECFVEIKSVTLEEAPGEGFFPDSVSVRGQKHLRELMAVVAQGHRAVLFFCVQHTSIKTVAAASHIDAAYGKLYAEARTKGVEVIAYNVSLTQTQSVLNKPVGVSDFSD